MATKPGSTPRFGRADIKKNVLLKLYNSLIVNKNRANFVICTTFGD